MIKQINFKGTSANLKDFMQKLNDFARVHNVKTIKELLGVLNNG